ncbi:helix-turn-helix domain-containing protein [Nocardia sp. NPDC052278]|uniref:helix-turn-helix domain-containing protein n=1 Tax=unclassified Nocardia TaxID=2637762 RepID=UPI003685C01A
MDKPGSLLRLARESQGVSLSAVAARTHFSKSMLGMLENDQRDVKPEHIVAYSRALNIPISALTAPPNDPIRLAHEWLVSDSAPVTHSAVGHRVGRSLADDVEQRVVDLRHLDDAVGGKDLFPLVVKELEDLRTVINECSYADDIGRRLLTAAGELSQLAGWVASDAGYYGHAQYTYLDGAKAASQAGDRILTGQLLSSLSYQIANVGHPDEAVLLARTAVKGAQGATPVVAALLTERVAWAAARARDRDGAMRALDTVDDTYQRRTAGVEEPEWVYWVDRSEIDVMAGRCFVELGDPSRARPLLQQAIDNYPKDRAREVALYQTWLAESYARNRDFDAAQETIGAARKAADGIHSARLERRVVEIELMLSGRGGW